MSALPHATKKTSPLSLFTQAELHNDELLSVTSAEDWTTKTKNMTKGEKDELTNRMAAFILSLEDVDAFVPETTLPKPARQDLQSNLQKLLTTSPRITLLKDFVQPHIVIDDSGKNPAGYHGQGLNALVNLLDDRVSALTLWQHLRGALSAYYDFVAKNPEYQWHALAMAIIATLTVYQIMVNRVPKLFPGVTTPDIDSVVGKASKTASGSPGAGSSRSATTSNKADATGPSDSATRSGGSGQTPAA
jgi:hypothetical protein